MREAVPCDRPSPRRLRRGHSGSRRTRSPEATSTILRGCSRNCAATPRRMIIRGRLKPDVLPDAADRYLRRCLDRPGEPAPFERAAHRWVMLDADETKVPFNSTRLEARRACVEAWRASLPEGLREAACIFQFSAKQHLSRTLRGHAWFWLDAEATDGQLRAWANANGFDPSVFNPVQPHYTADPVFAEGYLRSARAAACSCVCPAARHTLSSLARRTRALPRGSRVSSMLLPSATSMHPPRPRRTAPSWSARSLRSSGPRDSSSSSAAPSAEPARRQAYPPPRPPSSSRRCSRKPPARRATTPIATLTRA